MSKCVVELCDRLGLKNCRDLNIDMPLEGGITITTSYFADEDDIEAIKEVTEKYDLVARKQDDGESNV